MIPRYPVILSENDEGVSIFSGDWSFGEVYCPWGHVALSINANFPKVGVVVECLMFFQSLVVSPL